MADLSELGWTRNKPLSPTPFLAQAKKDRARKGILDTSKIGDIGLRKLVGTYSKVKEDNQTGAALVSWIEQALETLAKRPDFK